MNTTLVGVVRISECYEKTWKPDDENSVTIHTIDPSTGEAILLPVDRDKIAALVYRLQKWAEQAEATAQNKEACLAANRAEVDKLSNQVAAMKLLIEQAERIIEQYSDTVHGDKFREELLNACWDDDKTNRVIVKFCEPAEKMLKEIRRYMSFGQ
jgi:hypothetical protein